MKNKNLKVPVTKMAAKEQQSGTREKLDRWCQKNHIWVIGFIIVFSVSIRIVYFQQTAETLFIDEHTNLETDMSFFHLGACKIADGDVLSKIIEHPQHKWMEWVSDRYFLAHPDKLEQFKATIGSDTLNNNPTKMLWNQWYGQHTFQQEPLYPYFVALNYSLFGKNVQWVFLFQLLFGILTNLLIYFVTYRYFGALTAAVAALLAVFFGPMLFFEMVLLRSSIAVFSGILLIYVTGTALRESKFYWWVLTGITAGLALLVHSFFILYVLGVAVVLLFQHKKNVKKGILFAAGMVAGVFITLSPAMIRNISVDTPPLSLSSTAAVSFITMNNGNFKSFTGWNMDVQHLADIMDQGDGKLLKVIIPTIRTHGSLRSYMIQVWDKLHATFSSHEISNNVNYYLVRESTPILFLTFITFLILSPLAIAGMFLSWNYRFHAWPLYLLFTTYLFAMLAFMVLARYRIIMVPVLIPFAALTITELLKSWKGWKNYLVVCAIVILGFWVSTTGSAKVSQINSYDYVGIWSGHYVKKVKEQLDRKEWDKVARELSDFISRYEPGKVSGAATSYRCADQNEAGIFDYFSGMHANLAQVLVNAKDSEGAGREREIAVKLKNIAARQPVHN